MTYFGLINYQKALDWDLGKTTVHLMPVFSDLESWANPVKPNDPEDNRPYYLLFQKKILKDIPYLGSVTSISRSILELETKGIIESINKHYAPAYRLTEKGLSWKRKPESENANGGESAEPLLPQPKVPHKKERKKNEFALATPQRAEDLSKDYADKLFQACIKMALAKNIPNPQREFEKFMLNHSQKGNKWANWKSAFQTWCIRYDEFNKPNGGESDNGLYK